MSVRKLVIFKSGSVPHNEQWYIQQVCSAIRLSLYQLEGADIDIRYVSESSLNQPYVLGYASQSGFDISRCTLTPFNDADGGRGLVLKVLR
jgi:hypothetical protein